MSNLNELKERLRQALDDNDLDAIIGNTAELKRVKAEAEAKEREARLAKAKTATDALDSAVVQLVKQQNVISSLSALAQVYGKERSVSIVIPLDDVNAASVMPLEKARVGRASGGGGGKTKDQYGMSLDAVFQSFATDGEKAELAKLQSEHSKEHRTDGTQHVLKTRVKNRAINEGKIASVK